jgi:glycosyltransferase involved in cell wall biosynthesis
VSNAAANLLMLSGDTQLATGRQGVFHGVLEVLSRHFARIDVIAPRPEAAVTTRELFGNVHLHPGTGSRLGQLPHLLRTARRLLGERKYAIATSHDYGFFYNGIAAYRLKREFGLPYLSEIHHVPGHPLPASMRERLDKALARVYVPFAARHAAAIRAVNHLEVPELLRRWGVPEAKIRVIPSLYLDHRVFAPAETRKRFDLMACGRLVANKRFDLLFDAVARLKAMGRAVSLRLVGSGPLEGELLAQARRLGIEAALTHDRFLATPADLATAYREAKIFVCTSASEGGPRVTCEAMACGIPCISTPVGLMRELIDDGRNGLLVGWNASELAAAVVALLDDDERREEMGRLAGEAVLPFEREAMIGNYAKHLLELAAEPPP